MNSPSESTTATATMTVRCMFCETWNRIDADKAPDRPKCGKCAKPILLERPLPLDDATFARTIAESGVPVLVDFYADWCGACKKLEPTIAELKQQYGERLNFVELDVTNEETTAQAAKTAQKLGIGNFFETNKKKSSLVAVVGKNGKVLFQTHYSTNREGSFERETYVRAFDEAIAKS